MAIIAVDIDGTLTGEDNINCKGIEDWVKHYINLVPNRVAIAKILELGSLGHQIILYSSRYEEDRDITEAWLMEHGVQYDDLVLGKLKVDLYIDNRSCKLEGVSAAEIDSSL